MISPKPVTITITQKPDGTEITIEGPAVVRDGRPGFEMALCAGDLTTIYLPDYTGRILTGSQWMESLSHSPPTSPTTAPATNT